MRVLGVDPGLTRCGVGVVDGGPGLRSRLIEVSVVRTPSHADVAHRLLTIVAHVEAAIEKHRPDAVAIEQVFSQHNVMTVIGVAQATGVVAVTAARHGIPVAWHTPSEVKAAVSGNGNADKAQVTAMVTRLLRLTSPPKPADAADALALAICHLMRSPMQSRMASAARQAALAAPQRTPRTATSAPIARTAPTARAVPAARAVPTAPTKSVPTAGAAETARSVPTAGSTPRISATISVPAGVVR